MYYYLKSDATDAERKEFEKIQIRNVIVFAALFRLIILAIIYLFNEYFNIRTFYLSDDVRYERICENYLINATSPIDINAFEASGATSFLSPFWPYLSGVVAYIFGKNVLAVRFFNIFLSCACCYVSYRLAKDISGNKKTALLAAKLCAFMPYFAFSCCFMIKDVYLSLGTLTVFWLIVRQQQGIKTGAFHWIMSILFLVSMYYTRGAVTEFLLLSAAVFICVGFFRKKQHIRFLFVLILSVVMLAYFGEGIIESFGTKVDTYGDYAREEESTISIIRIDSPLQLYKFPGTYLFSMIMPICTSWFENITKSGYWLSIMTRLNVSAFPIAVGNFIYLFMHRKKNPLFYYTSFAMYSAVIILSLGVFRHYFFLLPLLYINYALFNEKKTQLQSNMVLYGSIAIFISLVIFSAF